MYTKYVNSGVHILWLHSVSSDNVLLSIIGNTRCCPFRLKWGLHILSPIISLPKVHYATFYYYYIIIYKKQQFGRTNMSFRCTLKPYIYLFVFVNIRKGKAHLFIQHTLRYRQFNVLYTKEIKQKVKKIYIRKCNKFKKAVDYSGVQLVF